VDFNRIINGMLRAIRLDKEFYEEVEHDPSYSRDALVVVVAVSLIGAIGSFLSLIMHGRILQAIVGFILGVLLVLVGFFIWVFVAHWVGTSLFKGQGDRGEVQRALGFAYSPQILNVFSFIPCVGWLISLIAWVLTIVTGFIAIRQSLDQDNTNAALTMIVSAVVVFIITAIITAIFAALGFAGAAITGGLSS
jgi:Yip1 domain